MDNPETQSKYAQNGKVMLATSILLFLIILLLIFLHVYRPSCFRRRHRRHRHLIQTDSAAAAFNESLHPSVLNTLPTFTYSSDTHRQLEECVVCLSELSDGDKCRVLTNCNHAFHSHCVDKWFRSRSNCPLCRTSVYERGANVQQPELTTPFSVEPSLVGFSSFPALIGCPRKSLDLELVSVIVELEDWRRRDSDPDSGRIRD